MSLPKPTSTDQTVLNFNVSPIGEKILHDFANSSIFKVMVEGALSFKDFEKYVKKDKVCNFF